MQQTDFPFEVLIHDDASTDGTADIIREYEAKYPEIIKPIYQTENQYSKGVNVGIKMFDRTRGKYIAFCEGDDFWCDPQKLRTQYDFMEAHPDYSACFCGNYVLNEFERCITPLGFQSSDFPPDTRDAQRRILLGDHSLCTAAAFFRADVFKAFQSALAEDVNRAPMGDLQIFFHLAGAGRIQYIRRRMFAYRRHAGSASSYGDPRQQPKFLARYAQSIGDLAQRYGFGDLRDEINPSCEVRRSFLHRVLRRIKRSLRGDFRVYRAYRKQTGRQRILLVGAFLPE